MAENSDSTLWQHIWGWQVISVLAVALLGLGGSIMTEAPQFLTDVFFLGCFSVLTVKFWTWEGARRSTPRNRALALAVFTSTTVLLFLGSCYLNHFLNLPRTTLSSAQEAPRYPTAIPPAQKGVIAPLRQSDTHLQLNTSELHQRMRMEYWYDQFDRYYPGNKGRPATQQRVDWINKQMQKEGMTRKVHLLKQQAATLLQTKQPCSAPNISIHDNVSRDVGSVVKFSGGIPNCTEIYNLDSTNVRDAVVSVDSKSKNP